MEGSRKAEPVFLYSCECLDETPLPLCGLFAEIPTSKGILQQLPHDVNRSPPSHWHDQNFKLEDWHNHYEPSSRLIKLPHLPVGNSYCDVYSAGSGLAMILTEELIVVNPMVEGEYNVLPQPNHIDLSSDLTFSMKLNMDPVFMEWHKDRNGYYVVVARSMLRRMPHSGHVDIDVEVEIYDSRTDTWRPGNRYQVGTARETCPTCFRLGELVALSRDRKRVATYDVEEDRWREYEFYSCLPELQDEGLRYCVLKAKKHMESRLLVVAAVCRGMVVEGDILAWSIALGSPPVKLLQLNTANLVGPVDKVNVTVGDGCITLGFRNFRIPDILYDFESGTFYWATNYECRRLVLHGAVRPCAAKQAILPSSGCKRSWEFKTPQFSGHSQWIIDLFKDRSLYSVHPLSPQVASNM